jgi:photosystem II stability/assembly factor-like uncharacterized protein
MTQPFFGRTVRFCSLLLLSLTSLPTIADAQSTWRAIADSRPFLAVWMANSSEGWAVGTGGGLSRTTDGGVQWTPVASGVTTTLRGVWGSAANNVWAVGDGGTVIRWNGTAWSPQPLTGITADFHAIHGLSASAVWAVGSGATILHWNGSDWVSQTTPSGVNDDLFGVWAAPNGTVMAVGERGRGLRYNGSAWSNNATGAGNGVTMQAVWGSAANSIWAVGTGGVIRFWNGTGWSAQTSGTTADLSAVQGANANAVWAAGAGGELRFFNGSNWLAQNADTNQNLLALEVVSSTQVLALGNRRTVSLWDGEEWEATTAPLPNAAFPAIWAADDDRVWFGGAGGLILRWNGTTFTNTNSGTNRAINAIWGLDHANIWAVGANGTILRWNGTAWIAQTSGVTDALNGVWGTSPTQVWAVGANGTILRWNGSSWSKLTSGTTDNLNTVWARNSTNAWAVGQQGTILKWSGSAWTAQASGVRRNLLSVWGAGTSVWAGGAAGTLLKLTGTTWTSQTSGVSSGITALTGTDATTLWAAAGPQILKSDGSAWTADGSTEVGLNLSGAFALSPTAVYLSTNSGMLFTNQPTEVPQITVESMGSEINTGEGVVDFGPVEVTQNSPRSFTILNTGTLPLTNLALSKDGAHAADFLLSALAETELPPAGSAGFTVTFSPTAKGLRTANIRLASNDPTEPSFLIQVTGSGFYEPVIITQQPQPVATAQGTATAFTVAATGTEAKKYQWRRNGVSIKGATSATYNLPNVAISQAGTYSVVVSNPAGSQTSANASLVVADAQVKTLALPTGATFQYAAPVAGTVASYLWRQGPAPIPDDPRYTGWASKTLQIRRLVETDAANYFCDITTAGGSLTTETRLIVYNAKPVILTPGPTSEDPILMPDAIVGGSYAAWPVPIDTDPLLTPTSYSASGLPKGLTLNRISGIVSGVPTVALAAARDYPVVFTAANAKGKTTARALLRLHPLPAQTIGSYSGPVERVAGFYSGLGGRVDLTIGSTGAYSGKLVLAGTTLAFKGTLSTTLSSPLSTATAVIRRVRQTDLQVSFTVDPSQQRLQVGQLFDGTFTPSFQAWRNLWTLPEGAHLPAYIGQFNLALKPPVADAILHPQGVGFARFSVVRSGRLTVSGVLADATAFTCSTFIGPLGEVLIYRQLYSNRGSVSGHLLATAGTPETLPPFADSGFSQTLQWSRPALNSRTYRAGFGPIQLTPSGGRYLPPDKFTPPMEVIDGGLGTSNTALSFTDGGIADTTISPNVLVRLQAGGKVGLPAAAENPRSTRLTISSSTGALSGSFRLLDQNPAMPGTNVTRNSTHRGLLIREGGVLRGYGFFLLAKRPAAASTEKPTTTDLLSGQMSLTPTP